MPYVANYERKTPEGYKLFEHRWMPEDCAPRAVLVFVHGIVEHAGRYADFAKRLNDKGLSVCAYDLRGHGRSEGPRVHVGSFSEHVEDLGRFIASVRDEFPSLPLFLMGHSMGGAIVTRWTIENDPELNGLILSAPAVLAGRGAGWQRGGRPVQPCLRIPYRRTRERPYRGHHPARTGGVGVPADGEHGHHQSHRQKPMTHFHGERGPFP